MQDVQVSMYIYVHRRPLTCKYHIFAIRPVDRWAWCKISDMKDQMNEKGRDVHFSPKEIVLFGEGEY